MFIWPDSTRKTAIQTAQSWSIALIFLNEANLKILCIIKYSTYNLIRMDSQKYGLVK